MSYGSSRIDPAVGLCSACTHARKVVSGRGSTFWLCQLAAEDQRFRRYPPLPVRQCPGFNEIDASESGS
ncbi:MAG: hypothetical protein U5Q44_14885 [Dehalococcoidia bacterium]|nr:hypothetical protein [Dehalococcoidia bacterium]